MRKQREHVIEECERSRKILTYLGVVRATQPVMQHHGTYDLIERVLFKRLGD